METAFGKAPPDALRNVLEEQKNAVLRLLDAQHMHLAKIFESRLGPGAAKVLIEEVNGPGGEPPRGGPFSLSPSPLSLSTSRPCESADTVEIRRIMKRDSTDTAMTFQSEKQGVPARRTPPKEFTKRSNTNSSISLRLDGKVATKIETAVTSNATLTRSASRRHLLPDVKQLKEDVKKEELRAEGDVTRFYKRKGFCQSIARATCFEYTTFLLTLLNSVWIGIEADYNDASNVLDSPPQIQFFEHAFCVCFLMEICIRFGAFERKLSCLRDSWFVFDAALVVMMVIETWILPIVFKFLYAGSLVKDVSILTSTRLLRLTRCARLMRLLRSFPEILILMKGVHLAAHSVCVVLVFLVAFLYICSMIFMQLAADTSMENQFGSVGDSMWILLMAGIFPDYEPIITACGEVSIVLAVVMLAFVFFVTITIMNLIVAVTVQTVTVVSAIENEKQDVNDMKIAFLDLGEWETDYDGTRWLPIETFKSLLEEAAFKAVCKRKDIDIDDVHYFLETNIYNSEEEVNRVTFQEAVELLCQLRGSSKPKVKDIVHLRERLTSIIKDEFRQLQYHSGGWFATHGEEDRGNNEPDKALGGHRVHRAQLIV